MLPKLFQFGPFAVYTYGLMMMSAFFFGILLAAYRAKRNGIAPTLIWDLSVWILLSSLVGARLLYVLTHIDEFRGHWLDIINPIQSGGQIGIAGMSLLGGITAAIVTSIYYIRKHRLELWSIADIIAPSVALGIALGRVGCFFNGCCYGQPTQSWLGIIFPPNCPAGSHFPGTPVLPTQLFTVAWDLLLCAGLLLSERWKKFPGFTFAIYLICDALFRIWVDTLRVYDPGEFLVNSGNLRVTISQGLSAGLFCFGVWLWVTQKRKFQKRSS